MKDNYKLTFIPYGIVNIFFSNALFLDKIFQDAHVLIIFSLQLGWPRFSEFINPLTAQNCQLWLRAHNLIHF